MCYINIIIILAHIPDLYLYTEQKTRGKEIERHLVQIQEAIILILTGTIATQLNEN